MQKECSVKVAMFCKSCKTVNENAHFSNIHLLIDC